MTQYRVYCWSSGLLEIGNNVPDRALPLVIHDDREELSKALDVFARRLFDGSGWLAPKATLFFETLTINGHALVKVSANDQLIKLRDELQGYLFDHYAPRHRFSSMPISANWGKLDAVKYRNAVRLPKKKWKKFEAMKILKGML